MRKLSRRNRWAVVAAAVVVLAWIVSAGLFRLARSTTVQTFGKLVPRVETSDRVVALTFDDGPTAEPMDEVLTVLASRDVRATFFVNGVFLEEHPELGRRLVEAGHELGNHTYSHDRMESREPSREALPIVIDRLKADGYRFLTMRELLDRT